MTKSFVYDEYVFPHSQLILFRALCRTNLTPQDCIHICVLLDAPLNLNHAKPSYFTAELTDRGRRVYQYLSACGPGEIMDLILRIELLNYEHFWP